MKMHHGGAAEKAVADYSQAINHLSANKETKHEPHPLALALR